MHFDQEPSYDGGPTERIPFRDFGRFGTPTPLKQVREFMAAMGQKMDQRRYFEEDMEEPIKDEGWLEAEHLAWDLIKEEAHEVEEAWIEEGSNFASEDLLKELTDLVYVICFYCAFRGWDLDEAFRRVHQSNMSKFGYDGKPICREDGKILKGPNYKPPFLEDLVAA